MTLLNAAGSNNKETFVQALKSALSDFYDKESGTNLEKLYSTLASVLVAVDRDVSATRNDNVLSATIANEVITRGVASGDHLGQEGAFEITRVGFVPSTFVQKETHRIEAEDTVVFLNAVPLNFEQVRIFNAADPSRATVSEILEFNEEDNTVTVAGVSVPGLYAFEYISAGNTTKETETIQVPAELFQMGWNEGGFGNFGFGE